MALPGERLWRGPAVLSVVPVLVMTLPMCLLLRELALGYEARPLAVGEDGGANVLAQAIRRRTCPRRDSSRPPPPQFDVGPVRVPAST